MPLAPPSTPPSFTLSSPNGAILVSLHPRNKRTFENVLRTRHFWEVSRAVRGASSKHLSYFGALTPLQLQSRRCIISVAEIMRRYFAWGSSLSITSLLEYGAYLSGHSIRRVSTQELATYLSAAFCRARPYHCSLK